MVEKGFIYVRNSTPKQAAKRTQDNQKVSINAYLEKLDIQIMETFQDLGLQGDDPTRSAFNEMVSRLNEVDCILVFDLDRLARDLFIGMDLMKALIQHNVKIYESRTRSVKNLQNDQDQLLYLIGMWSNAQEKRKIKARQKEGIKRYKKNHDGKWGRRKTWGTSLYGKKLNKNKFIQKYKKYRKKGNSKRQIARNLSIHIDTLYRRLNELQCEGIDLFAV